MWLCSDGFPSAASVGEPEDGRTSYSEVTSNVRLTISNGKPSHYFQYPIAG